MQRCRPRRWRRWWARLVDHPGHPCNRSVWMGRLCRCGTGCGPRSRPWPLAWCRHRYARGRARGKSTAVPFPIFSRMTDCATFGDLATVETVRRGVLTAGRVVGVVDGALWEQGFLDLHRPDAVRILDW